jgi:anti-sigma-K factor RskA
VRHCDEETLSLLALGESAPADVEAHVAGCARCGGQLAALRRVVITARTPDRQADPVNGAIFDQMDVNAAIQPVAPPPRVWDQIAAATGVRTAPRPAEVARHAAAGVPASELFAEPVAEPSAEPIPEPSTGSIPEPSTGSIAEPSTGPTPGDQVAGPAMERARPAAAGLPVPTQRSRSRSWTSRLDPRLLGIAAGCLIVGLLGGVIGTRLLTDDAAPGAPVVAATRLDGLPAAPSASGRANVVQDAQGRTLDLDVRKLGPADGFYEVWLIDPTVTKMVPIGVLSGTEGRFTLPDGVNLADYPVVDVSVEPLDGNPVHSGKSVLRGTLRS